MILRELVLHDYGPFRGRHVIDLRPQASTGAPKPICLFGALNGSGKTSILDAILLALYGARARCSTRGSLPYPDFLKASVNTRASARDGASVELEFDYTTAAGTTLLRVVRSWRSAGKSTPENVRVFENGAPSPGLTETWAQHVEDLIPLGISNLYFFDGEQARELANQRATTELVRQSIRTLLGLDVAERLSQDLRILISRRAKKSQNGAASTETVGELEEELRKRRKERRLLKEDLGELRLKAQSLTQNLETAKLDFASQGGTITQQRKQIEKQLKEAEQQRVVTRSALQEAATGILPLALVPSLLEATFTRASQELAQNESEQVFRMLEKRDALFERQLRKAGLENHSIDTLLQYLAGDRDRRRAKLDGQPYLGVTRALHTQLEAVLNGGLEAEMERARGLLDELGEVLSTVARFDEKLSAAAPSETIDSMLQEMGETQTELSDIELRTKRVQGDLALCEHQIAVLEERARTVYLDAANAMADDSEHQLLVSSSDRVQRVMEEYQRVLKNRRLMELESLITERFQHLARKQRMVERIEVDAEDFNLRLYDADGYELDRTRLSAGEQQLLSISFLWALGLSSGRSLPVVIDTPLARMDSKHRNALVERYFPHASHQVLLLSTDTEIDREYYRMLDDLHAIDRTYLIEFDSESRRSSVRLGYFFEEAEG